MQTKKKVGRPSKYNIDIAKQICLIIATSSKGISKICRENKEFPCLDTIFEWLKVHNEFSELYTRAREMQADFLADEIIEISDHSDDDHTPFTGINVVNRDRLRIETRKWVASKLKPKKYGEKLDLDGNLSGEILVKYADGINSTETT